MATRKVRIRIEPRAHFRGFLESTKRWAVLVAHRRAGKTVAVVQKLIKEALTHERPGPPLRYAYIAPTRDQAKDIAWAYLKEYTSRIPQVEVNESELKITLPNRATIRLYSGENYERMRGLYFDGVVSDEDADIPPHAFDFVIMQCLLDYNGWHVRIGTPKGRNAFQKSYAAAVTDPDSYALMLRASESGILSAAALETMRRKLSPEAYAQEMECDFSIGRPGAIYARLVDQARETGRVRDFQPSRGALVHTFWDIGSPANTAVVYAQFVGPVLQIIDFDLGLQLTTAERVAHMLAKPFAKLYGSHCLPHDAEAVHAGGLSFQQELEAAGLANTAIIPKTVDVERRINGMTDRFPNIYFAADTTEPLLDALENYHRKEDAKTNVVETKIVHDWASHPADAFGYIHEAEEAGVIKAPPSHRKGRPKVRVRGLNTAGAAVKPRRRVREVDDDDW